jgi:hypothetical protein
MPTSNCSIVFLGAFDPARVGLACAAACPRLCGASPLAIFDPLTPFPPKLGCFGLGLESDTPFEEDGPGSSPLEMLLYRMVVRNA